MEQYKGDIFSGEFLEDNENFYLTQVKSMETGSELSLTQLIQLRNYLAKQQDNFMLTVNDQIPIMLKEEEMDLLLDDLSNILNILEYGGTGHA
ncbi:hypothetical protein DTX80_06105 [Bacilli bacterium]|nr:hypothetical protein WH51_17090 [Bacilli bacterium VT-13-104]PZD86987.1 hypothetical protein DEJ64_06225 [Bacilli bacterium]PZD88432.1 hypothetical protein DEJ60_06325 [Bacilli bacterium]PZD91512.1 hypothetical protein DEJ66_06745 [Bacilli bacterium]RCO06529.1 hypothetical protein DTX80_06105 [Bacilli bacterium]